MKKKVMAIAVAGLFMGPGIALAQKSTVEIYGRANLGLDQYKATGSAAGPTADFKSRIRVFDGSSRVGFRGTEDLGSGIRAIFQIETGVNVDTGNNLGQGGQVNASSGFWASRDSFAGLDSNFGRVTFGRQSIYWANGVNAQFSANYINQEIPWTNGTMLGRITRANASLPTAGAVARQSNTLQYTTPTFGGFNATVSYSPNAQEAVQAATGGIDTDGTVLGLTLRGTFGAFYGQFDYAQNEANTLLSGPILGTSEWQGFKLGGSWAYMPGARVGVIWVRSESNNAQGVTSAIAGVVSDIVTQDGWTLNWEHTFGNVQVMAQYGATGDMKDCTVASQCANTKSTAYMVGGRYFLSKRTWLYASYNKVNNKVNQNADYTGGSYTSVLSGAGPGLGSDPQIIAVGLFHAF